MTHLGGSSLFLGDDVGWGKREALADFAAVLSQYVDVIVCRTTTHDRVEELAKYCTCSVINGLTDFAHPCQALADLYTLDEMLGPLAGQTLAFVGDANNVARSLADGCGKLGVEFAMAVARRAISSTSRFWTSLQREVPELKLLADRPTRAKRSAARSAVYTDVWTSMGQEAEARARTQGLRRLPGERRADGACARRTPSSCTACRPTAAKK